MTTILAALQLAIALLTSVTQNPNATAAQKQQAISYSYSVAQAAAQYIAELPTSTPIVPDPGSADTMDSAPLVNMTAMQ